MAGAIFPDANIGHRSKLVRSSPKQRRMIGAVRPIPNDPPVVGHVVPDVFDRESRSNEGCREGSVTVSALYGDDHGRWISFILVCQKGA